MSRPSFTEHRVAVSGGSLYVRDFADRVASLAILNSAYDEPAQILWPELVELFATRALEALAMAVAGLPEQFGWILH